MPGSEWLYYKIYTGAKTADVILTESILPLAKNLKEKEIIEKWFFIRYADPHHHIRVRFLLADLKKMGKVMQLIHKNLKPYVDSDQIWNIQMDTYNRELERYGTHTMLLSETLFHHDSIATLNFLSLIEGIEGEKLRWLFGLRAIDNLLNAFNYTSEEKLNLIENLKTGFGREFNMSRPLKKQLDDKYRLYRNEILNFLNIKAQTNFEFQPIIDIHREFQKQISPIAAEVRKIEKEKKLEISLEYLMSSYVHMLMNRLFKSKNRLNEMVCYDFLFRYYKSYQAIQPKKIS